MDNCVIFTGGVLDYPERLDSSVWKNAFVIAADSGYRYAQALGIIPDLAMGDYDSLGYIPENCGEVMTFPKEKDDSDLMLAIREALRRGYKDITIIGALGGRFDHTFSNLQSLGFIAKQGASGKIISADESITLNAPGEYRVRRDDSRSLSLFAYTEAVTGLTVSGVKYPLENSEITSFFPIGLSNVITDDYACISFKSGLLLIISSRL
ncbi:thiamine diphosphokinase [Ruminococcus sp. Marseille-P6503]|uniref:thiamine diphosphokinase n=1 Tax=Ruminococcus sp. Marseille-P6503 TaxID=2364796 RepID=UPI000F51EE1F|nr:thiamine diphosphokinase [Ruminococcus sp. Marseille-P6503]